MAYGGLTKAAMAGVAMTVAGISAAHAMPPQPPPLSAYLELYGQGVSPNVLLDQKSTTWAGGGVAGRATFWLNPGWSTQVDAAIDTSSWIDENSQLLHQTLTVAGAHVSARDPRHGLVGGFAGFGDMTSWGGQYETPFFFGGLEGQLYLNNLTFYAQAGDAIQLNNNLTYIGYPTSFNVWFAQAMGRFFVSPNTKLEAGVGYFEGNAWGIDNSVYPRDDIQALTYEAEVEHRFAGMPLSVFARASGFTDPSLGANGLSTFTVAAGLRIRFGRGTLLDDDRSGTTLTLPDFQTINWARWWTR